jgi:hypothetical protein
VFAAKIGHNPGMVALIRTRGDEVEHREFRKRVRTLSERVVTIKVNRPKKIWSGNGHLTLLIDHGTPDKVTHVGWTTIVKKSSSDLDVALEIAGITSIGAPVPYDDVLARVDKKHHRWLVDEGTLTKGSGQSVVASLLELRPDLRGLIAETEGMTDRFDISDSFSGQVLAMQRDATICAVRMAGMLEVSDIGRWDRPGTALIDGEVPPTYLEGVQGQDEPQADSGHEDRQIDHDAETMLGWISEKTQHHSWRLFTGFGQRLYVANANADTAEATLGTDLIYYNESRQSLILIQYKRMRPGKEGYYYPDDDKRLPGQLRRMEAVDRYVAMSAGGTPDFRMVTTPSWLKICQAQSYIPNTADMIPGMYFTREQFQRLRRDSRLRGERDGVRFGYANVPSYLDNTMFNRLVETGLIGTSGTSTDLLRQQIIRSFNGQKSLVVAALYGEDMNQSERNSARRKAAAARLTR